MKRITDKDFVYTPADKTTAEYLKEKFERVRKEYEEKKEREKQEARLKNLIQMKRGNK